MTDSDLGANQFTFAGDQTQIIYDTQTPVPDQGGLLQYQGPEGSFSFTGDQISLVDSDIGTIVTVPLSLVSDIGSRKISVLVPTASGVTPDNPVTFPTIAVKTTGRGSIESPGVELAYTVLPLVAQASQVFLP